MHDRMHTRTNLINLAGGLEISNKYVIKLLEIDLKNNNGSTQSNVPISVKEI